MQSTVKSKKPHSPKKAVPSKYLAQQPSEFIGTIALIVIVDGKEVSHSSITRIEKNLRLLKKDVNICI